MCVIKSYLYSGYNTTITLKAIINNIQDKVCYSIYNILMLYVWMKIKRGRPQKFITVSRHARDVSSENVPIQKKRSKKESYKHRLFSGSLLVPSPLRGRIWAKKNTTNAEEKLCWIYLVWCYYSFLALCVFHKRTSTVLPSLILSMPFSQYYRRVPTNELLLCREWIYMY